MKFGSCSTSGRAKTITLGEFEDTIMKEAEKRTKKLKQEQKNTKDAAIALVDGQEFLLIRWKAMSRDGKWFRFGWDAAKAIREPSQRRTPSVQARICGGRRWVK